MITSPYILPFIKWWRLVVAVTLLATAVSTISAILQPDLYESRTTLVVGTTFMNPNPDFTQFFISQQLAGIYADMGSREPIQNATKAALGINWLPQYKSSVIPNTQMVEITVSDTNPKRAQIIANELAKQLKLQSPTFSKTEAANNQDFINAQLASLQDQIRATDKNIQDLQKSLVGLNSASQIANIEKQISQQTEKLTTSTSKLHKLPRNSRDGAVNILSVVEPANCPSSPVGANKFVRRCSGRVGWLWPRNRGSVFARVSGQNRKEYIGCGTYLPPSGHRLYFQDCGREGSGHIRCQRSRLLILAENFRLLRSNIEFYRLSNPAKTIMITSPSPGTGKTTVAANLALSISQEGRDVVLVDADLRRPAVHSYLKMSRKPGLYDVIRSRADIQSVVRLWNGKRSLKVITAGNLPSKFTEIAGARRIAGVLSKLKEGDCLLIVDRPPLIISEIRST